MKQNQKTKTLSDTLCEIQGHEIAYLYSEVYKGSVLTIASVERNTLILAIRTNRSTADNFRSHLKPTADKYYWMELRQRQRPVSYKVEIENKSSGSETVDIRVYLNSTGGTYIDYLHEPIDWIQSSLIANIHKFMDTMKAKYNPRTLGHSCCDINPRTEYRYVRMKEYVQITMDGKENVWLAFNPSEYTGRLLQLIYGHEIQRKIQEERGDLDRFCPVGLPHASAVTFNINSKGTVDRVHIKMSASGIHRICPKIRDEKTFLACPTNDLKFVQDVIGYYLDHWMAYENAMSKAWEETWKH